jgi:hypothetical protein
MNTPVGPMEMMNAVKAILDTLDTAGMVVVDPVLFDDEARYASLVEDGTGADGWLIAYSSEEPPTPLNDGATQNAVLTLTAIVRAGKKATESARVYFDRKITDAKAAFMLPANRDLGIVHTGAFVSQKGIYAPDGYVPRVWKEFIHHTGRHEMKVWTKWC